MTFELSSLALQWIPVYRVDADSEPGNPDHDACWISTSIAEHVQGKFSVETMREADYPAWRVFARTTPERARLIRAYLDE